MTTPPSFTTLPTEILQAILQCLSPFALLELSRISKHIHAVANTGILWRHFCQTHFQFWHPRHNFPAKLTAPLSQVDWKTLFRRRIECERDVRRLLNKILESQQGRIKSINEVARYGYDAKEELLRQVACPDDAEDVLARRYYAKAIMERIQRELAIKVWKDLADGQDIPIDKALAAYDVFTRTGEEVDFESISRILDQLTSRLLKSYPNFGKLGPRKMALTLASFLRSQGYEGVQDAAYRQLRNSFIGIVLNSAHHQALPLIQVAIYCALARRLGLDARPCGFVFHVYCMVFAPPNTDLDGNYNPNIEERETYLYLDPFHSAAEVPRKSLIDRLRDTGIPKSEYDQLLSATGVREMVLRTARNIMNSVQAIRQHVVQAHAAWLHVDPDVDNAFYATLWAMMVLGPPPDNESGSISSITTRRRPFLPYLLEHFQTHYPWDVILLEQHVIPLFCNQPEGERLLNFVRSLHNTDDRSKPVSRRKLEGDTVKFKVGQLFQHKRYQYEGVVTGWDVSCDAGEEWIQHMGVDRLSQGREQSFYHVLVSDKSIRYVAEENIDLEVPYRFPTAAMLRLAGRHFKRWDPDQKLFVSNVRDEYPDD